MYDHLCANYNLVVVFDTTNSTSLNYRNKKDAEAAFSRFADNRRVSYVALAYKGDIVANYQANGLRR